METRKRKSISGVTFENKSAVNIKFDLIQGTFRLFELPKAMSLPCDVFDIIGCDNEDAVLCDEKSVYSIKKVDSSNKIFILSGGNEIQLDIVGSTQHYYEVSY